MTEVIRNIGGHAGNIVSDALERVLKPLAPDHDFVPITHEEVVIDSSKTLCEPEELGIGSLYNGWQRNIVARLAVPDDDGRRHHMAVVRAVGPGGENAYSLRGLKMGYLSGMPVPASQEILPLASDGEQTTIGRSGLDARSITPDRLWPGQKISSKLSRTHLSLAIDADGMLHVSDTSTNGSWVSAKPDQYVHPPRQLKDYVALAGKDYSAEYTYAALRVADIRHLLDEEGLFAGREVITSKAEVGGDSKHTIDIRNWLTGTPAVIVDPNDPEISDEERALYRKHFKGAVHRLDSTEMQKGAEASRTEIGWAINDAVRATLQYDREWVERHNKNFESMPAAARVENLSAVLRSGRGACEHMMLLTAWTGGEFRKIGLLDRPVVPLIGMHEEQGGHAAAMIMGEKPDGSDAIVIDPATSPKGYVGPPLANHWDYRTPEQRQYAMQQANILESQYGVLPKFAHFLRKHAYRGILS
jgi:hypothetical protein